jgi:hypothetical protein
MLFDLNQKSTVPIHLPKTPLTNVTNIRAVTTELFHVDRRTDGRSDMTKQIVAFLQIALRAGLEMSTLIRDYVSPSISISL